MSSSPCRRPLGPDSLLTFAEVCRELGMGRPAVQAFIKRHGIKPGSFAEGTRGDRWRWGDFLEAAFPQAKSEAETAPPRRPQRRRSARGKEPL